MEKQNEKVFEEQIIRGIHLLPASRRDDIYNGIDARDPAGRTIQVRHRKNGNDVCLKLEGPGSRPWTATKAQYWLHIGPDKQFICMPVNLMRERISLLLERGSLSYHGSNQKLLFFSIETARSLGLADAEMESNLVGLMCNGS